MQTQNQAQIARILAVSPAQVEMKRRNYSRIFISPSGESVIDSILFQGQRIVDEFIPLAHRAIAEAGLKPYELDELHLRSIYEQKSELGGFQQYLQANTWLCDDQSTLYDIFIEVSLVGEELMDPQNMETYNAIRQDGFEFENPLCIKIGIEQFQPEWDEQVDEIMSEAENTSAVEPKHEPEVVQGGGRGQVKNPANDGRLKENRRAPAPEQLVSARQNQDRQEEPVSSLARQHGKPGRVRRPELDGRMKSNRARQTEGAVQSGR